MYCLVGTLSHSRNGKVLLFGKAILLHRFFLFFFRIKKTFLKSIVGQLTIFDGCLTNEYKCQNLGLCENMYDIMTLCGMVYVVYGP